MAYYFNLGVTQDASDKDIRESYKKLVIKYHPDKNPGNESIFIQIDESYKVLSNEYLRIIYDYQLLHRYMQIKPILEKNNDIILKLISSFDEQITSCYNKENIEKDLADNNIDKIVAIFIKSYYQNDEIFKKNYINLILALIISYGISKLWSLIKKLLKIFLLGLFIYYIIF